MREALQIHGAPDVAEDLSVQFHVPVRRDEENAVKLREVVFIKTCRLFLVDEDDVPQKHCKWKELLLADKRRTLGRDPTISGGPKISLQLGAKTKDCYEKLLFCHFS